MRRADLLIGLRVQIEAIDGERGTAAGGRDPLPDRHPRRPEPPGRAAPPRIVFAGRFEPRKGPDMLVEALPHVVERFADARLVLVGRDTTTAGGRQRARNAARSARASSASRFDRGRGELGA